MKEVKCLDHGYVRYLEHWGSDSIVCQRARMSNDLDNAEKSIEDDEKLIDYLYRNAHTSPLEMAGITVEMKLPIFVARQLVRHRTASINEVSARYVELPEEFYIPEDFHVASPSVKQGRTDTASPESFRLKQLYKSTISNVFDVYSDALSSGISKEEARIILPVATYTRWAWSMDMNNLLKFLSLRCESHAQYEIRVFAEAVLEVVKPLFPSIIKAWERHGRNPIKLTKAEAEMFISFLDGKEVSKIDDRSYRILKEKLGITN